MRKARSLIVVFTSFWRVLVNFCSIWETRGKSLFWDCILRVVAPLLSRRDRFRSNKRNGRRLRTTIPVDRIKRISDARDRRDDDGPVARWFPKAPFIWHRIRPWYHDIRRVMWRIQTHPLHLQQDTRLHPSAAAILYNGKFRGEMIEQKKKRKEKKPKRKGKTWTTVLLLAVIVICICRLTIRILPRPIGCYLKTRDSVKQNFTLERTLLRGRNVRWKTQSDCNDWEMNINWESRNILKFISVEKAYF